MANTLDVWTDAEYMGGVHANRILHWTRCVFGHSTDGSKGCTVELPSDSDALAFIAIGSVFRIGYMGSVYEYRVLSFEDSANGATTSIVAVPLLHDLGFYFLRLTLDGLPNYTLAAVDIDPTMWIDNVVLPSLAEQGISWYARGSIEPTALKSMDWDGESILSWLWRLAENTGSEVTLTRNQAIGKYDINLVALGGSAPTSICWVGRNVVAMGRSVTRESQATVIRPTSPSQSGGIERESVGVAAWPLDAVSGDDLVLGTLKNGLYRAIRQNNEFNGMYAALQVREGVMGWDQIHSGISNWWTCTYPGLWYYDEGTDRTLLIEGGTKHVLLWNGAPPNPGAPTAFVSINPATPYTCLGKWPIKDPVSGKVHWLHPGTSAGDAKMYQWSPSSETGAESGNMATAGTTSYDADYCSSNERIYWCESQQTGIGVYRPDTNSYITSVILPSLPLGIAYQETADRLYVWCWDRRLRVIRPSDNAITYTLDLTAFFAGGGQTGLAVACDGTYVYVCGRALVTSGTVAPLLVAKFDVSAPDAPSLVALVNTGVTWDTMYIYNQPTIYWSEAIQRVVVTFGYAVPQPQPEDPAEGVVPPKMATGAIILGGGDAFNIEAVAGLGNHYITQYGYGLPIFDVPSLARDAGGVFTVHLGHGRFASIGNPSGHNTQVREILDTVNSTQTLTLADPFPTALTERITDDPSRDRPGIRIATNSAGDQMTELEDADAVALYGKMVREIRTEDYFDTEKPGIINLVANGFLSRWDADDFPLGFSKGANHKAGTNGPRWYDPDDDPRCQFECTVSWTLVYTSYVDEITVSGLPAGLVVQPGDTFKRFRGSGGTYWANMTASSRVTCTGTNDVIPVWRIFVGLTASSDQSLMERPDPVTFKAWKGTGDVLALGRPSEFGSWLADGVTVGQYWNATGASATAFEVSVPSQRLGDRVFVGVDVLFWGSTNSRIPMNPNPIVLQLYSSMTTVENLAFPTDPLTPFVVKGEALWEAVNLWITNGEVARAIQTAQLETSWELAQGYRNFWLARFASLGQSVYLRRIWAYVGIETRASAMTTGEVEPVFDLWKLGADALDLYKDPQISYTVQAVEDDTGAPFTVGGLTRLVDRRRGIDTVSRIVAEERLLDAGSDSPALPALTIENRDFELTLKLIARGII